MTQDEETFDSLVGSIVKIGNQPNTVKLCEPHVNFPQKLQRWSVERTLISFAMLREMEKMENDKTKENGT